MHTVERGKRDLDPSDPSPGSQHYKEKFNADHFLG